MKRVLLTAAVFLCWAGCMSKHFKPSLLDEVTIKEQKICLGQSAVSVKARIGPPDEDLKVDQRRIVPGMFIPGAVMRAGVDREFHKWRYGDTFLVFEDNIVTHIYICPRQTQEKECR